MCKLRYLREKEEGGEGDNGVREEPLLLPEVIIHEREVVDEDADKDGGTMRIEEDGNAAFEGNILSWVTSPLKSDLFLELMQMMMGRMPHFYNQ